MHGVKRQPKSASTAEARSARKAKEASKLASYLEIESLFFSYKRASRKDLAALHHTTKLLTLNPELYTVWNYRREILLHIFASASQDDAAEAKHDVFASLREGQASTTEVGVEGEQHKRLTRNQELLQDDLSLTEHALRAHPKVYWIWNHRMWCLTQSSSEHVWQRELRLVEKMLDLDPRNFHGWNCRRAIVQHLALSILSPHSSTTACSPTNPTFPALLSDTSVISSPAKLELLTLAEKELSYTLKKIESNFSNFSAWHQRTLLLPHVWRAKGWTSAQIDAAVDAELELVKQAMYTDPSDQSVWFYHRWLVDLLQSSTRERQHKVLQEEVRVIEELFELEPDSKWCAISLAHYSTLLKGLVERGEEKDELGSRAKQLLEQLMVLDPDRKERYRDLLEDKAHF